MRSLRRRYRFALGVVALIGAYPLAGLAGGAIPSNAGWRAADNGVTIYIESNGVHVGLIVPKVAAGVDWRSSFPPRDLTDPRYAAHDHVAIGWGEHDFFLNTPTWADISPRTIVAAAVGSNRTLLHVEHIAAPHVGGDVRAVVLRPVEYRRLAAYVRATLVERGEHHPGYAGYDVFYPARGRYDAYRTCNAWAGDALRFAGVRVGAWTPFPATVLWWF
ncbi:TIGR02117 family protein [Sphingomonas sp. SUN019]|uniref:TIGR02117 family protein n=1 Tax=Sphingomonas sp. SUN019 TaxID=2937788 RepID=UPI00216430DF|nr:TIGR02117 family protein [Sphingomonas sp. SUN019]UVO49603.1 TIGR02117 family protein [Sphingomonas sp. SUN019]